MSREAEEPEVTSLARLAAGTRGRVLQLSATGALRRRLLDLGVLAGQSFVVETLAPLDGPVEITVKGYRLSLRKQEAATVLVVVTG